MLAKATSTQNQARPRGDFHLGLTYAIHNISMKFWGLQAIQVEAVSAAFQIYASLCFGKSQVTCYGDDRKASYFCKSWNLIASKQQKNKNVNWSRFTACFINLISHMGHRLSTIFHLFPSFALFFGWSCWDAREVYISLGEVLTRCFPRRDIPRHPGPAPPEDWCFSSVCFELTKIPFKDKASYINMSHLQHFPWIFSQKDHPTPRKMSFCFDPKGMAWFNNFRMMFSFVKCIGWILKGEPAVRSFSGACQFFVTFLGWLSDPFKG